MKAKQTHFPNDAMINDRMITPDYSDAFSVEFVNSKNYTVVDAAKIFFLQYPAWVESLIKLRNFLVKFIGLSGDSMKDKIKKASAITDPQPGDRIVFEVIARSDDEILLGENDKHLNFVVSVVLRKKNDSSNVSTAYILTKVKYNISLGRFYFFFVKPFHRLIMKSMLNKMT